MVLVWFLVGTCQVGISADSAEKFEKDIQKFEAADLANPPEPGGVLLVGSSTIRMWKTDKWFPDLHVINRGFGGSQMSDLNFYVERVVLKYRPRVIAVYEGDNDIGKGKTPREVFEDYRKFLERVAKDLPGTEVIFIPIKPSLKRWELWPVMAEANRLIRRHTKLNPKWHYAEIAPSLLGDDGTPRKDLFAEDGLHLNEQGYEILSGILKPMLGKR